MPTNDFKILLIDSDEEAISTVESSLKNEGFSVICSSNSREAIQLAATELPQLVLLDLLMNEDDYIRLVEEDGNKLFYSFNEELFLLKTSIKVKSNKEKDFSKEQTTTYFQKRIP